MQGPLASRVSDSRSEDIRRDVMNFTQPRKALRGQLMMWALQWQCSFIINGLGSPEAPASLLLAEYSIKFPGMAVMRSYRPASRPSTRWNG